jgi:acyl-homoserine-lactone acylase
MHGWSGRFARVHARVALVVLAFAALAATVLPLAAQGGDAGSSTVAVTAASPTAPLRATIRTTDHGIPHIVASDFSGLGFGYGYTLAENNLCVLADTYVTVNGQRSRYFGPDASYVVGGNGSVNNNLNSDFFYQRINDDGIVENLLTMAPPRGPRPEIKDLVHGYVAGYNKYLRETGVANLPDASCRGAAWVREINEMDVYRRFYQLGLIASQGVAIDGIGGAQPPVGAGPTPPSQQEIQDMLSDLRDKLPLGGIGSNAVALGSQATDNGSGMLLGNPHFPWDGSERFFQAQLTIPGQLDVSGASLFGVPLVLIGHTQNLAWSHTVSTAYRFTPFELKLVPGSPTSYIYDGDVRHMRGQDVTVQARRPDGSLESRTRTLYSDHRGPILTSILGLPLFPWTPGTAWSIGDANADNFRYLNHFLETDMAQSTDELYDILRRNQGIPWVNTIGADSAGKALYADISVVPHVPDEQAAACNTELGRAAFAALGLPVLDGSLSACEWGSDPDAVSPGTFGPSNLPHLFRPDYVTNSNDSYWIANPQQPLTGFDRIIGDEGTERSLRTRLGLVMVEQRLNGSDGLPGNRFTRQQLQDMVFNNRQYAGELWRDELASFCESSPTMTGSNGPVDVSAACPVLRAWDVHDDLDSNGAILFRRFATRALNAVPVTGTPGLFTTQFDANDPVHTPSGLNIANPAVEQSFADAVTDLRNSGIPLNAPLRGWQYERRGSEQIPIHGGPGGVGVFNAINVGWVPGQGFPNVPHGSSFVMAVQFNGGCPDDRTILTYSQSTNPSSPYFGDQTRMFSRKEWVNPPFCENEIQNDPSLQVKSIEELHTFPRPGGASPLRVSLVPRFRGCTTPNSAHAAPLAFPSCVSPSLESPLLTTSTQGRGQAFARFDVQTGDPATTADEADLRISASATDVRNAADGSDYAGRLALVTRLRITDRLSGGSGDVPGTVSDYDLSAALDCVPTTQASLGSSCSVSTTGDTLVPGFAHEGARAVMSAFDVRLDDSGPDGTAGTGDESTFLSQGILAP